MEHVKNYQEFMKGNRENWKPEGFDFDVDQFENLIDWWTPFDTIPIILNCDMKTLDDFCYKVYNMSYKKTYGYLLSLTNAFMSRTFKCLASTGNNTAMSIVTKNLMKLDEDKSQNVNITFLNDLTHTEPYKK